MIVGSLLQSYSLWSGCSLDPSFLLKRLGLSELQVYDESFTNEPAVQLKLDLRAVDAILALCNYCSLANSNYLALRTVLTIYKNAAEWIVNPNIDVKRVMEKLVDAMLSSSTTKLASVLRRRIVELLLESLLSWTKHLDDTLPHDPAYLRKCIMGAINGILANLEVFQNGQESIMLSGLVRFLDGTCFDIRLLLADAPSDYRLEEVVSEHFSPLLTALNAVKEIVVMVSSEAELGPIRTIVVDYTQSVCVYLVNSATHEPFLCTLLKQTLGLYSILDLTKTECESVLAVLRSFKYFRCYANFCTIFQSVCQVLVLSAEQRHESSYLYIAAIKSVLQSLTAGGEIADYPDKVKTMREGGLAIGGFVRALLQHDQLFCESLVSNLVVDFPLSKHSSNVNEEAENTEAFVEILGSVAAASKDETVSFISMEAVHFCL